MFRCYSVGACNLSSSCLYVTSFLIAAVFSTLTGTSWGSAATVGVVLIGISTSVGADSAIVAGAVVGGSLLGDKLPLSDTTNMAAIATGVDLFEHIRSMLWSTVPSASFAVAAYLLIGLLGFDQPAEAQNLEIVRIFTEPA